MTRPLRVCLPGQWHHVRHRALPGIDLLRHDGDAVEWLAWLAATSAQFRVAVHGFVLMPTEIRWVGTPKDPLSIAGMMKELARRASRRRGWALWGGRYGCALVEKSEHSLSVLASLDHAAVCAGLATEPALWPHGSAWVYSGRRDDGVGLSTPDAVWALGNTPFERERRYSEQVASAWRREFDVNLLEATDRQWAVGSPDWIEHMEQQAGQRMRAGQRGRPAHRIYPDTN
jgi:putative transposase